MQRFVRIVGGDHNGEYHKADTTREHLVLLFQEKIPISVGEQADHSAIVRQVTYVREEIRCNDRSHFFYRSPELSINQALSILLGN